MLLLIVIVVMWYAPKIATVLDVLTRPPLRRAFGGTARFLASVVCETIFFLLLSPIMWFSHTLFLAGLPFGKRGRLDRPGARRPHRAMVDRVPPILAAHSARPWHGRGAGVHVIRPAIPYALLIAGGPLLSIPLAVMTAWPRIRSRAGTDRHRPPAGGDDATDSTDSTGTSGARGRGAPRRSERMLARLRTARGVVRSLAHLLWQPPARGCDGPALPHVRAAGRSRVRHRRPCRRPRRGIPPAWRTGGRGRAAAGAGLAHSTCSMAATARS